RALISSPSCCFQAEDGIRDFHVTGVQTCALPILPVYPPYMGRVAGPLTRSVRDAALLMNVLTGADARDFMSLPPQAMEYRMAVEIGRASGRERGVAVGGRAVLNRVHSWRRRWRFA